MKKTHQELCELLVEFFDTHSMDAFYPYLAKSVIRTSAWDNDDVVGKKALIKYFRKKEVLFSQNIHYFNKLASLKYINGKLPTEIGQPKIVTQAGSIAGQEEIRTQTRIIQWYPEGEPVILLYFNLFDPKPGSMIRLELNDAGLIGGYHIVMPDLYAYDIQANDLISTAQLFELSIQGMTEYLSNEFQVTRLSCEYTAFPHLIAEDRSSYYQVVVLPDIYPNYGRLSQTLKEHFQSMADNANVTVMVCYTRLESKGLKKHRIHINDNYQFHFHMWDFVMPSEVEIKIDFKS